MRSVIAHHYWDSPGGGVGARRIKSQAYAGTFEFDASKLLVAV
jgi:hypothetical protein